MKDKLIRWAFLLVLFFNTPAPVVANEGWNLAFAIGDVLYEGRGNEYSRDEFHTTGPHPIALGYYDDRDGKSFTCAAVDELEMEFFFSSNGISNGHYDRSHPAFEARLAFTISNEGNGEAWNLKNHHFEVHLRGAGFEDLYSIRNSYNSTGYYQAENSFSKGEIENVECIGDDIIRLTIYYKTVLYGIKSDVSSGLYSDYSPQDSDIYKSGPIYTQGVIEASYDLREQLSYD